MPPHDLSAFSRSGAGAHAAAAVPRPGTRWATRIILPALIILGALAVLAYAARESLRPSISVRVAPVVPGVGNGAGAPAEARGEVVQAPGWIEADPYPTAVPALDAGVIREVLVLEGQRVKAGEVVARLVDDDAKLARKRAMAGVDRTTAAVVEARAAVAVELARVEEARESLERIAGLTGTGTVAEGEITQRRLKVASQRAAVEMARSAVVRAESEQTAAGVAVEEAELALSRTEVRSPVDGVVLLRLVEPGQRVMPDANNPFAGVVVRLYDPDRLQVRVDIPLADAAKVHEKDVIEITTEALPDRVFHATLSRFMHEANLQKNTVQIKAAIADPAPELKPEMLAKARITTTPRRAAPGLDAPMAGGGMGVLRVPRSSVVEIAGAEGSAWVLDQPTSTIHKRRLKLGRITPDAAEALEGLRPGDRVVLSPAPDLREGARVKPTETKEDR